MEKSNNSRDDICVFQSQQQDQLDDQQYGPNQTPSEIVHALQQALLEEKAKNKELAAEITTLKEEMASKELGWVKERKELLVKDSESAKPRKRQCNTAHWETDSRIKGKEEEICSLNRKVDFLKFEHKKMERYWQTKCNQTVAYWKEETARIKASKREELESSFNKTLFDFNAEWESRWFVRQEEVFADMQTLQADWEKKMSQVTFEKNDLLTEISENKNDLLHTMAKLSLQEIQNNQSEKEWREKYKTLQDSLTLELAEKEASWKRTQEQTKVMEEEWTNKSLQMEERIKLLTQKNIELQSFQELAGKTDKDKAKMKKDEMKAKKEFEKRLKKERKEKEEKEKKEKEEKERKEKERLKREKKEKEEREKKEKKERKERLKREKKEKKI